jgi:hypothetical protein
MKRKRRNKIHLVTTKQQINMCDKATYIRYLQGEGTRYGNSNMYIIHNKSARKSTEERALQKIAPPARLNPDYANQRRPKEGNVGRSAKKNTSGGGRSSINQRIVDAFLNGPR